MISMAAQEASTRLSDLVADRRAELRLSLARLADRCIDPETGVQEWKIGRLLRLEKRQPMELITAEQIRALAAGLDLPVREVQDAAGEQFHGVETTDLDASGKVKALTNRAWSLAPEDLDRLLAIAETFPINPEQRDESSK
jgi:transcriptional regulator with XRE-family HTH domain